MEVSYGIALCLLITLETIRIHKIFPPLSSSIQGFYDKYLDRRDGGVLVLSHIYLLAGCSFGLFLAGILADAEVGTFAKQLFHILPHIGYVLLGLGDSLVQRISLDF